MPTLRITAFGNGGLNTDQINAGLQPGEWDVLTDIDIRSSFISSGGGNLMLDASGCPIDPHWMFVFATPNTSYLIISDGFDVYLWDGATYTQLSTGWTGGRVTYTVFLGTLIVNSETDGPWYWTSDVQDNLLALPGWPANYLCVRMIAYNNFLFAIRQYRPTDDSGPYRVAWSDTAGIGQIPNEWVPTPENSAGSRVLADSEGHLYTAAPLRDSLVIYKADGAYICTPRTDHLVFDIRRAHSRVGCDAYEGVAEYGGQHLVLTRGDIVLFDGQNAKSVAVEKVREELFFLITKGLEDAPEWQESRMIAFYPRSELWIMLKSAGSVDYDNLLKFDMEYGSFSRRVLNTTNPAEPKKETGVTGWAVGWLDTGSAEERWDYGGGGEDDSWDDGPPVSWGLSQNSGAIDDVIFGARVWRSDGPQDDPNPDVVDHREVWRTVDGTYTNQYGQLANSKAQKSNLVISTLDQNVMLKRIYPEMQGNMEVLFTIGVLDEAGGDIRWGRSRLFRAGRDRMVNVRSIGQPLAIKIESPSPGPNYVAPDDEPPVDARFWKLGALTFEFDKAGKGGNR